LVNRRRRRPLLLKLLHPSTVWGRLLLLLLLLLLARIPVPQPRVRPGVVRRHHTVAIPHNSNVAAVEHPRGTTSHTSWMLLRA
jgi:hypothetical protein